MLSPILNRSKQEALAKAEQAKAAPEQTTVAKTADAPKIGVNNASKALEAMRREANRQARSI